MPNNVINSVVVNGVPYSLPGVGSAENLATVETDGGHTDYAYAVGEHLIYDGQYYKVTSAIAVGGAIVTSGTGKNVEAVDVSGEIEIFLNRHIVSEYTSSSTSTIKDFVHALSDFFFKTKSSSGLFKIKDSSNIFGFGANHWCKGYIIFSNSYVQSSYSVGGEGIIIDSTDPVTYYRFTIYGNDTNNNYGVSLSKILMGEDCDNTVTCTDTSVPLAATVGKWLNDNKVAKNGDTMTGSLAIKKSGGPRVIFQETLSGKTRNVWIGTDSSNGHFYIYDSAKSRAILQNEYNSTALKTVLSFIADTKIGIAVNGTEYVSLEKNTSDTSFWIAGKSTTKVFVLQPKSSSDSGAVVQVRANGGFKVGKYDWSGGAPIEASAYNSFSSRLVKENIKSMTDSDGKAVLELNPVHFDYIESFGGEKNRCGLIAEEVLDILPEIVTVPDNYNGTYDPEKGLNNEILSIDYSKIVPHLIKLCQVQQEEINELKERVAVLESK